MQIITDVQPTEQLSLAIAEELKSKKQEVSIASLIQKEDNDECKPKCGCKDPKNNPQGS